MSIDPNIKQKADDIRTKVYGSEVRESLASGIEAMSQDVVNNTDRQTDVESQFQDVIENTTDKDVISAPEIIAARNGEANLKARLDKNHNEVTAQLAQIDQQKASKEELNALGQLKLSGEFATLADLEAEHPTGSEGIFLVIEDGYTYRWDGSVWVQAVQFQSTGIRDKSVTLSKVDFIEIIEIGIENNNINDLFTQVGKSVSHASGTENDNESFISTDYQLIGDTKFYFRYVNDGSNDAVFNDYRVIYYDENKNYISGEQALTDYTVEEHNGWYGRKYDIPDGAVYVRFSLPAKHINGESTAKYKYVQVSPIIQNKLKNDFAIGYIHNEVLPKIVDKPLKNLNIVMLGDSIIGNTRGSASVSNFVAERTGATVHNIGFGGSRIAEHKEHWDAFSFYRLAEEIVKPNSDTTKWQLQDDAIAANVNGMPSYFSQHLEDLKAIDFGEVDFITIAGGTNDYTASVLIDNDTNPLDTTTYAGSLRVGLDFIMETYQHLNVLLCSPMYRFWRDYDNGGIFIDDSDTRAYAGQTLPDFVNKGADIAKEYKIAYLDNYFDLGINIRNKEYYFPDNDGTHPNTKGNEKLGSKIGIALVNAY